MQKVFVTPAVHVFSFLVTLFKKLSKNYAVK